MAKAPKERDTSLEWVRGDEEILAQMRPGEPFDARASFQAFGERQYGDLFLSVTCCCELPGETPRRWEAALELRKVGKEKQPEVAPEEVTLEEAVAGLVEPPVEAMVAAQA